MADAQTLTVSMLEPDIAAITIDTPGKGVNILSRTVLDELENALDELEQRSELAGVVIRSGKPGTFIAGADLREFAAALHAPRDQIEQMSRRGQRLFARLCNGRAITVAAIDGLCLGGGAELACWCDRRVMTSNQKTELGFPEVKLGLLPGWGGTVRAPRIIGLANALELITTGNSIDAAAAAAMGLANDLVAADDLDAAAVRLIRREQSTRQFEADRKRWSSPIDISPTELEFLGATASAVIQAETKGKYPAPPAILELMLETALLDTEPALAQEAAAITDLFGSAVNAALLNVFFLTDRNKKDKGTDTDFAAAEVRKIGVIGAGIMGAGIAGANLRRGVRVLMTDADESALTRGLEAAVEQAAYDRKLKGTNKDRALQLASQIAPVTHDDDLAGCDVVIEAIVENKDIKHRIYQRLSPQLGDRTVLGSNTSTIPITELATAVAHPDRFCGIHFFNPVNRMKLVEVIRGRQTSGPTIATVVPYLKRIGKMPIVVNDGPGFLVNRMLMPYLNEAQELICAGASIKQIDRAATDFGMAMGPLMLYDIVGFDTAWFAGRSLWEAFPDRVAVSPILPALMRAGRKGTKNGKGFYSYENKRKRAESDPEVTRLCEPYIRNPKEFSPAELTDRLFLPMLLEATRAIQDGIVRDVRDVDLGLIFGLGFPPFRGGLLFWADTIGAPELVEKCKPYEALGKRYQPTELLIEMARDSRKFYDLKLPLDSSDGNQP